MIENGQARHRTCLIAQGRILQESWQRLLKGTTFGPIQLRSDLRGFRFICNDGDAPELVIFDLWGGNADVARLARQARSTAPESRIVFVLDKLSTATLLAGFRAGANGFLDRNLSRDAMVSSLRLVMLEQTIYPVTCLAAGSRTDDDIMSPSSTHGPLSDRELQILRCLIAGDSNKQIGRRLAITDTTAKVHLRNILQKIQVSNRTQAAIWAISRGLSPIEDDSGPTAADSTQRLEQQLPA